MDLQKIYKSNGEIVLSISNKDHLNELIAKAEKSWGGVGVESFVSDLRDVEKEQKVLENLKKAMKDAYNKTMEEQL